MLLKCSLIAAAVTALAATAMAADPYPRLGGINIGSPHNYDDPAYTAKLAKLNVAVINTWPGWGDSRNVTLEQVLRNIHAINPNTKIFAYHISMEAHDTDAPDAVLSKLNQMRWWVYANGSRVRSAFGARENEPVYSTNVTLFAPKDSSGYMWYEWDARWTVNNIFKPNPSLAGIYEDNVFWKPRVDVDWNRDGVVDSKSNAAVAAWLREGYRARFDTMRTLMPGKYQIGNVADWGEKAAVLTEYQGMLNGGILEGMMGASYSPESWSTWAEMLRHYRKVMGALAAPKYGIFGAQGAATDYKMLRYSLTSCLMDDGYFDYKDPAKGYTGLLWFDEYSANLGAAITAPPAAAWKNGVWRRDFENGIALVNPKGNGTQTITLEEDFQRLKGTQAPAVNSGATTRTITLAERDGIILKRVRAKAAPHAPTLMSVH